MWKGKEEVEEILWVGKRTVRYILVHSDLALIPNVKYFQILCL